MFLRIFLIAFTLISMQLMAFADVVSVKKNKSIEIKDGQLEMLFKVDFRDFDKDRIVEYRFYDQPFVNVTVMHDPGKTNPKFSSFDSKMISLDKGKMAKVEKIHEELKTLKFKNNFPWKENFNKRGDIFYVHAMQEYLPVSDSGDSSTKAISVPQVFIFYKGFKEDYPAVYAEITELIFAL